MDKSVGGWRRDLEIRRNVAFAVRCRRMLQLSNNVVDSDELSIGDHVHSGIACSSSSSSSSNSAVVPPVNDILTRLDC